MNEEVTLSDDPRVNSPEANSLARRQQVEILLRPVLDSLYGTAVRLCGNETEAQDLVQEAALLAYRHFDSFESGTNFKAWTCKILTNCYRARYRLASSRHEMVDIDDVRELDLFTSAAAAGLVATSRDAASEDLDRIDITEVSAAIDALPEEYRVVAVLYFTQNLSYQEIAEALGCPVGTIRSRLHRARKVLQRSLRWIAEERGLLQPIGGTEPAQ